ncbi:hypothetical protein IT575_11715 [bacterium]|nr:hypothetical protein [bacterium]
MEAAKESRAQQRRRDTALIAALLRSLRTQRLRFWRGPGLILCGLCLLQAASALAMNIHMRQSGGSITWSPGMGSSSFLGLPTEFWSWAYSCGSFLGPAAVAWAWLSLAQMASRRLVDFFEDAAAPGLDLSLPLRFEAACRFAWPALIPLAATYALLTAIVQIISPVSLSALVWLLWPFELLSRVTPVLLPLLFITAVWLLAPRWGILLAVLVFMPDAELWRGLLQLSGLYTAQLRQLPHQRLNLGLPGAQLYGLALLGLSLWCIGRWRSVWAKVPLGLIAAALLADKISSGFITLPVTSGLATGSMLNPLSSPASVHILAGLRAVNAALTLMPYYVHGNFGLSKGDTLIRLTAFPLLALPVQAWFACLLYIVAPIYLWLCYLALRWILSRAPRDIISDHR